ncbi:hypothetical protein MTO96_048840 [Rhipicephalus appendiculatus]
MTSGESDDWSRGPHSRSIEGLGSPVGISMMPTCRATTCSGEEINGHRDAEGSVTMFGLLACCTTYQNATSQPAAVEHLAMDLFASYRTHFSSWPFPIMQLTVYVEQPIATRLAFVHRRARTDQVRSPRSDTPPTACLGHLRGQAVKSLSLARTAPFVVSGLAVVVRPATLPGTSDRSDPGAALSKGTSAFFLQSQVCHRRL